MGWGETRDRRRWERELQEQIRALPTFEDDTPDGGPVAPLPRALPRPPGAARPPRARRTTRGGGERRRTVVTVGVTLALVGGLLAVSLTPLAGVLRSFLWEGDRGESTSYAFLATRPGSGDPVTWDTCRPIHYLVNADGAPDGWQETLEESFEAVTQASGLEFVAVGETDDRSFDVRFDRRGRALPVLIGWATPEEVSILEGDTVGVARADSTPTSGVATYDTGQVVLDAAEFARMERAGDERLQTAIVMHELAHLVGLDHVDDELQLMYPTTTFQTTFGNGDREGLRRLGEGPCS